MATLARSTRVLGLIFAMTCLVCCANSLGVQEKLEMMKEQLLSNKKFIESEKAKFESERKSVMDIANCNMAKLNVLRKLPTVSASELKDIETLTLNTDAHVRNSFTDMAELVENLESKWEEMNAILKYAEIMSQLDPDNSVAYMA